MTMVNLRFRTFHPDFDEDSPWIRTFYGDDFVSLRWLEAAFDHTEFQFTLPVMGRISERSLFGEQTVTPLRNWRWKCVIVSRRGTGCLSGHFSESTK